MDRKQLNILFVNDDDLDCDCKETTLENLTIINIGISLADMDKFDIVWYQGKRGEKILKSRFTKTGKIN